MADYQPHAKTDTRQNAVSSSAAMPGADFAKWPKPEDIAKVIVFLCSEAAKVIHAASVPVFGNS